MIKPLKSYWIVISREGRPFYWSISTSKSDCIKNFLESSTETWKSANKYGWKAAKVNINFEPINAKK